MIGIAIANSIGSRRASGSVPVVPVATAATGVGLTFFTANWNAFSGASYYLLDVSLNSSFSSFVGSYQNFVVLSTSQLVSGLTESTTYYYRVRAVTGADADALAFFGRVYTAGGVLSYTEVSATETLVANMKSAGVWSAMRAVYPMVGASAAACAQNLKSSSFTGTFTSGWTFASTGVTPNGTSAYMNTNLTPSASLTQDSTHLSFYSRTDISSNQQEMGSQATNPDRFNLEVRYNGNLSSDQYNFLTGRVNVANGDSRGFYIGSRTNSSTHKAFKNNAQIGTTNTTASSLLSLITNPIWIGVSNGSVNYSTKQCAFASIGDGLTDTQASNLYTAVQAFQTTLGRQVAG